MNIYADVTDEGLQPFYTYTLEEIAAQYEYDDNRMPIGKVYVQYDKDEYYLEDPTEVEDDDQLLTEDMNHDFDVLQREGLNCQICASHLDGTDMEPAIDILDLYGDFGNLAYPGDMIVYTSGVLYETIPEEVVKAVRSTS